MWLSLEVLYSIMQMLARASDRESWAVPVTVVAAGAGPEEPEHLAGTVEGNWACHCFLHELPCIMG